MADRQVQGPQWGEELRVTDDIALDVAGEYEGRAAVDGEAEVAAPAAGLGEPVCEVLRPGQPGAGQVGVGEGGVGCGHGGICSNSGGIAAKKPNRSLPGPVGS